MQDNQNNPKRFEDWVKVDCNECARYWDSSCDGSQGSERPCNSFLATRSVVIPAKINKLEKAVKGLGVCLILTNVAYLLHLLSHLLGR